MQRGWPDLSWEISRDVWGGARGGEQGPQQSIILYSTSSKVVPFPRETELGCLETSCKSGRSPGATWKLAALDAEQDDMELVPIVERKGWFPNGSMVGAGSHMHTQPLNSALLTSGTAPWVNTWKQYVQGSVNIYLCSILLVVTHSHVQIVISKGGLYESARAACKWVEMTLFPRTTEFCRSFLGVLYQTLLVAAISLKINFIQINYNTLRYFVLHWS